MNFSLFSFSNELLFFFHSFFICLVTLAATAMGKEALSAMIIMHCVLANLFVTKQITLFSLSATGTDAFIIGSVLGLNLLQEYFGSQIARRILYTNFFILFYVIISSVIQNYYIPNEFDVLSESFYRILSPLPHIGVVSMIVFFLVQYVDYMLFRILKNRFGEKYFVIRNFISVAFCQLLDTILFTFFGLYGIVHNILHVAIISYTIKLLSIFIISPLLFAFRNILFKNVSNRNI
jgi:queuosine precursor transporter